MKYKTFRALVRACVAVVGVLAIGVGVWKLSSIPSTTVAQPRGELRALPAEEPLRTMDREILVRVGQNINGDKLKDAMGGAAFKVNLYRDAGHDRINRLKIDLDRDDHWDEKWTIDYNGETMSIRRDVSAMDDDTYPTSYLLQGEIWVRQ